MGNAILLASAPKADIFKRHKARRRGGFLWSAYGCGWLEGQHVFLSDELADLFAASELQPDEDLKSADSAYESRQS